MDYDSVPEEVSSGTNVPFRELFGGNASHFASLNFLSPPSLHHIRVLIPNETRRFSTLRPILSSNLSIR
ncbi:unnamed protein product [Dovyalis caffra]|uniref:Uncharacterized protein n=1 Tax=Dovyalis caffra TaxID=77055 RepID=A0AAV1SBS2_9ROSI|nr:unnamed protein product [Dovyalis caffra]